MYIATTITLHIVNVSTYCLGQSKKKAGSKFPSKKNYINNQLTCWSNKNKKNVTSFDK